ncbi:sulfatase family protein [Sunxiuqinia dokdonensis]|uniref:sulfatase family protein n=1 Tax=Sunxiuqinia dokdonensis TaxID=1409788 RepID=UPI00069E7D0C|nr:sulfatase [Sunxiuqinia dokdonensis]
MVRKTCLITLGLSAYLCGWGQQKEQPNIVFYITDDMGWMDTPLYNPATQVQTPNLKKIAEQGLVFNKAFIASPACAPSRAALLTGLMPARTGAEANHTYPDPKFPLLHKDLQEIGYEVAAFGKVAHGQENQTCGFDFYSGKMNGLTENVTDYLDHRAEDGPIALLVGDRRPHVLWTDQLLYEPEEINVPDFLIDTEETREHRAMYYSDITGIDQEVGRIYELARERFGDNFVFIFSSDHGAQWPFAKWNLYDAGTKVPLVVAWPGHIKPDTRTDAMVSWVDIFPTLLEIAGTKVSGDLDGQSFIKVLEGKKDKFREYIFTTHSGDGRMNVYPIRSVRGDRFKFILNLYPENYHSNHSDILRKPRAGAYWDSWDEAAKTDPAAAAIIQRYYVRPAEEFYDLETDPTEQNNLIGSDEHQEQIQEMHQLLEEWMNEQGDTRALFETPYPISGPTPHELGIR